MTKKKFRHSLIGSKLLPTIMKKFMKFNLSFYKNIYIRITFTDESQKVMSPIKKNTTLE